MTYIRDLSEIPERVYQGDCVLRLTEGVNKPEETLLDYVVTPQPGKVRRDAPQRSTRRRTLDVATDGGWA